MRIVHVLRAPMGGVLRHVRDLAQQHSAMGHKVGIICDAPGTPGYREDDLAILDTELALGVQRVPMSRGVGLKDLMTARAINRQLTQLTPDVVHGHGAKGGLYARALSVKNDSGRRATRLYSPHGGSLHFDPVSLSGKAYFSAERFMARRTDRMIFCADFERRTYEEKIGTIPCLWQVSYNGLQEAEFIPVTIDDEPYDFLFIGEMRLLKGTDLFIDAIARLRDDGQRAIKALMVGDGVDKDAMRERITRLGLTDAVDLSSPMPAREAFAMARIVVIPSRAEAMPYIVLEALAAQCTLIASNVGGIPEIYETDSAALVTPDVPALTTAMKLALTDGEALRRSLPNRKKLRQKFSAEAMAASVLAAYTASQ